MSNAIDPIGASAAYGTAPRSMRANQAEEKEQIDLIKRLEEKEGDEQRDDRHEQNSSGNHHEGESTEQRKATDIVQISTATVSETVAPAPIDTETNENPEVPAPLAHVDLKA